MKKWELKEKVRVLRKKGLSYKEIRRYYPLSKSTISIWCRDIELTPCQKERLGRRYDAQHRGAKANAEKRHQEIEKIRLQAKSEIQKLSPHEFKIAGLMLYWAEGDKKRNVGVTNSDPELIKFMMAWFRKICRIPEQKFKASIYYHSGQNELKMKRYWSEITGISLSQFHKSIFKKEGTGQRKNILYNGTCKIRIGDENLRHRILSWIEEMYIPKQVGP